jgi:voltage-gated potassium channel Kch
MHSLKDNITAKGTGFNRLAFFLIIVLLINHFIACIWIFITFNSDEETNWITETGYSESKPYELYIASNYFVMQTLTTVGYGDISIVN